MNTRCSERRPTFAWLPFQDRQETQRLRGSALSEEDIDAGLLEDHLTFIRHRKLGFMWLVENDGGDLLLFPREDMEELQPVTLPLSPNKLLVYRADWMTYSYKPRTPTRSLVLQTWLMEEPPEMSIKNLVGSTELRSNALGITKGIPQPVGERIHCMSAAGRFSGDVNNNDDATQLFMYGTDSFIKIPAARFDIDEIAGDYHEKEPGKSYTIHAAMHNRLGFFDNTMFNISDELAKKISPLFHDAMEEGYACLYRSGYRRETLKGMNLGIWVGDVGTDYGMSLLPNPILDVDESRFLNYNIADGSKAIMSTRLSHALHLKGPSADIDTACSASLVAVTVAAQALRSPTLVKIKGVDSSYITNVDKNVTEAMPMGVNGMVSAGSFIALSGGQMLSPTGRCQTFNASADGYARGEGTYAVHLKISDSDEDTQKQLACVLGAKSNQDGRSATLTAPNGPAQQDVIRQSMREAGLKANQINVAECHGTGTALGDPIEIGSLIGVMEPRFWPLGKSSAKSNIGHCEASAGIIGFVKCILMLARAVTTPNAHLCELNPNLEMYGFPSFFSTEAMDVGLNAGVAGVTSFGMGGTNSRGDLWCQSFSGGHKTERKRINLKDLGSCYLQVTCPVTLGPIDYLTGEPMAAVAPEGTNLTTARRRRSDVLRDHLAPYDISRHVYDGGFRYRLKESLDEFDEDLAAGKNVRICGSWSGWRSLQKLEPAGGGWYAAVATLGESRRESFFFCLGKHRNHQIYPVIKNASPLIHVLGPDLKANGRKWTIDGRNMEVPAGTLYHIRFRWGHLLKQVHWEPLTFEPEHPLPQFQHTYAVVGTFNAWTFQDMSPVNGAVSTWEAVARIGNSGREEFRFIRDRDLDQALYPARPETDAEGVPVCGPDDMSGDKSWVVYSDVSCLVRFRLQIANGDVKVDVVVDGQKPKRWRSVAGWDHHQYYVVGAWNSWKPIPMVMDLQNPGLFRCRVTLNDRVYDDDKSRGEHFQVIVDKDHRQAWYPREGDALSGKQIADGPDGNAGQSYWMIQSPIGGGVFEINLDLAVDDRRRIVSWYYVSP